MKLMVAYPCHDMVAAPFAYDLSVMNGHTIANLPDGWDHSTTMVSGTYVHRAREMILQEAFDQGVDYLLWLDADMRFPKDLFFRLFEHQKDVVGCNYSKRTVDADFVGKKAIHWDEGYSDVLETNWDSTGIEEVDALGFGAVLMDVKAVRQALPAEGPWFWFEHHKGGIGIVGEDVYFCRLLKEGGAEIWVDQDLSKEVKHIGQFEYECRHAEAVRSANRPQEEPEPLIEVVGS